jgi:hypothetical protein
MLGFPKKYIRWAAIGLIGWWAIRKLGLVR